MKSARRGFTVIEMLVVFAIIVVLVGTLFAATGHVRENARQTVCLSNLRQMSMAFRMYCQDSGIEDKPTEIEKIPDNIAAGRTNELTFTKPYGWDQGKLFCPDAQRKNSFQDGYLWHTFPKDPKYPFLRTFSQEYALCGETVPLFLDDNHNPRNPDVPEPPQIFWLAARFDGSVARVHHRPTIGPTDTDPCFTGRPTL